MEHFSKEFFPTLHNNPKLAYFDNAATTQTHISVVDRMNEYYCNERCNVNRGDFYISQKVSGDVEIAREQVAELINADTNQVVFTSGATDGLNMIAEWCKHLKTVIVSEAEHSANILPWITQGRTVDNGGLVVIPLTDYGTIDIEQFEKICERNTGALLSITYTSNVTGITFDIEKIAKIAHQHGIWVCVDACQTIATKKIDVKRLRCDWLVFSGHKMYGPTGVGVLYAKKLSEHRPIRHGGGNIRHYDFNGNIHFYDAPTKYEVGTPNIAGILGLGIAAEWINFVGYNSLMRRKRDLGVALSDAGLFNVKGLSVVYPSYGAHERNVFSFNCNNFHPSDLSAYLGIDDIAVRGGKLCAHPIVNKLSGGKGVLRISTACYNNDDDIIKLVDGLCKAISKIT